MGQLLILATILPSFPHLIAVTVMAIIIIPLNAILQQSTSIPPLAKPSEFFPCLMHGFYPLHSQELPQLS